MNISNKIITFTFLLSFLAALLTSSYFEQQQTSFFKIIKNIIENGSTTRHLVKDNALYTYYDEELYINPVHVSQKVLGYSEISLINNNKLKVTPYSNFDKAGFDSDVVRIADFLVNNYEPEVINDISIIRYPYLFNYGSYNLKAPWYSGMAQGHAVIVLMNAWWITGNKKYFNNAILSANTLFIGHNEGGVLLEFNTNSVWFEEYADSTKNVELAPRVLNGNIFAIDGLFWAWYLTKNGDFLSLMNRAIKGIEDNIDKYDTGFWSYYGLWHNYANAGYHKIHIEQLDRILSYATIVESELSLKNIMDYKNKFELYNLFPFIGYLQRMYYQKNNMIYIIFFSNLFIIFLMILAILYHMPVRKEFKKTVTSN